MKKTLHIESSLKRYLQTLRYDKFTTGLLLGQNSVEEDFVVHLARTQIRREPENVTDIGDLKKEPVIEHIRNVIQILPGGMTVLGLFITGDASLLNATTLRSVKGILNAMNDFQSDNPFYFFDTNSHSKYILHYVDNNNITCKQFSSSQTGNQFDSVDLVFSLNQWHRISCYYDFESLLPLYLETVSNTVLHDKFMEILKYVSQSMKESVLLFNGEVEKDLEPIKSLEKRSDKEASQSKQHKNDDTRIIVDLYSPSASQIPSFATRITDYVAELKCFGTLCSDVYVHNDAIVREVIKAVKEDIIRSLYSRLTMHCHSLLEDLSSSGMDEMKIIHEPPRRISVRLPHSQVRFTDYLFPGEDNMSSLPAKEQLDLRDVVDEASLYEALEMETDASQFHNCENSKLDVKANLSPERNNLTLRISAGVVLALLLLVLAVLIQKLRPL